MAKTEDRRESARVPIELKVEYKKLNTFFADYTKNICKGGTFIRTPLELVVKRTSAVNAKVYELIARLS